jgi:signal transduction histidine kinase
VKDTGSGIPKEKQEAVFDRFVQADIEITRPYEGSGLGLAIAKAYAAMLGGKIGIESEEGKGSTFSFTINGAAVADSQPFEASTVQFEN